MDGGMLIVVSPRLFDSLIKKSQMEKTVSDFTEKN